MLQWSDPEEGEAGNKGIKPARKKINNVQAQHVIR